LPQNTALAVLAWNLVSHSGQVRQGRFAIVAAFRFSRAESMHIFEQNGALGEPNLAPLGASFPHSPHTLTAVPCVFSFCRSAQHLFEQKNSVSPRAACFVISKPCLTTSALHCAQQTITGGKFIRPDVAPGCEERMVSRSFNHSSTGTGDPV
jgi:hypothetical protein